MEQVRAISIIGYGNVASHLIKAFEKAEIEVTHILVRSIPISEAKDTRFTLDFKALPQNQLVLICVPDDSILDIVSKIDNSCPIAYTSGSFNLNQLQNRRTIGVFYPLQTFTKGIDVAMGSVPFFIEADSVDFTDSLIQLAKEISTNVKIATSEERQHLHLAAVFVNNFTNHLNHLAKSYLDEHDLKFKDLQPLLEETVNKLNRTTPFQAQTGPARRNDDQIIQKHCESLSGHSKEIYQLITKSIKDTYNDKL